MDMRDLQRKFNLLLEFAINECQRGELIDISIEWDTETPKKDISVRWGMPKSAPDWSQTQCKEYSESRRRILQLYLPDKFNLKPYRFYTRNNTIFTHCYIQTTGQPLTEE